MNANFSLQQHTLHFWHAWLPGLISYETLYYNLLNKEEQLRAQRFHFPIHKQRFILSRAILRILVSRYTQERPEEIIFSYSDKGKPFIPGALLQFNVSHSNEIALYGFSMCHEIGVDIEKVQYKSNVQVAKRFFSPAENIELDSLPQHEQQKAFYKIWSLKEAVVKAVGTGLWMPLEKFSVSSKKAMQLLHLNYEEKEIVFHLEIIDIHPDFQASFATAQSVLQKEFFEFKP